MYTFYNLNLQIVEKNKYFIRELFDVLFIMHYFIFLINEYNLYEAFNTLCLHDTPLSTNYYLKFQYYIKSINN